jgi:hypothetical protein
MQTLKTEQETASVSTISEEDKVVLRRARDMLENPGLAAKITNLIGSPLERAMTKLPNKWLGTIQRATEKALLTALEVALATVDTHQQVRKKNGVHRLTARVPLGVRSVLLLFRSSCRFRQR